MTRFERELNGSLGAFWKKNAEQEIAKMQARADNGEIRTDARGAAFWKSNGRAIPSDCAEILSHTTFTFDPEETRKAREEQTAESLRKYTRRATDEEKAEMRAAFGPGTTVVDIISGETFRI